MNPLQAFVLWDETTLSCQQKGTERRGKESPAWVLFAFAKLCCISLFLPGEPQPTQVPVPFQPLSSNKLPWGFL